ncbi:MAG: hypothetical protein VX876_01410 [Planctomycetota bacterium]|nr:hypothetical protein [Planctomycetota bacterium]
MAFIDQVAEEDAQGTLARIYESARGRADRVANIIRLMSLDPVSLEASMQFYLKLMKTDNALSAARKEMLATVVSCANDCFY